MSAEEEVTGRKKKVMYKTIEWGMKSRKKKKQEEQQHCYELIFHYSYTILFAPEKKHETR